MGRPQPCPNQWPICNENEDKSTYKHAYTLVHKQGMEITTLKQEQWMKSMDVWQHCRPWNHVWNGAKPLKQVKHSMQESSKLETSKKTYTMATQSKPQRAEGNQNSPKAGQDKTNNMLETSQHKLEYNSKRHEACKATKGCYTTPIKSKHGMNYPMKNRVMAYQNKPKNPLK